MNKRMCWMSAVVFCGAIAVGCGDDDSASHEGADGGDTGVTDGGGTDAGGGGAPGTGGRSAGTGGTMAVMTVKCGTSMCMPPAGGLLGQTACCADEATNLCGAMMGGMCKPPPKVDPSCPSITVPILGTMGSCCASNGMCGVDESMLGMGCVDYAMVKMSLGILGGVLTLPDAQSCGSDDHDAGTNGDIDGGN